MDSIRERVRHLESQLIERDEHLAALENLLRHILSLVPQIQQQMASVVDHTESSAMQIGDKVRFIYEKAQEHLEESNEINKQFSGKPGAGRVGAKELCAPRRSAEGTRRGSVARSTRPIARGRTPGDAKRRSRSTRPPRRGARVARRGRRRRSP